MSKFTSEIYVNSKSVDMNEFVNSFVTNVVLGAISSLKGVDELKSINVAVENKDVNISVNGKEIMLTPFPEQIIANTLLGLVSSLKGIEDIKRLDIKVNKT